MDIKAEIPKLIDLQELDAQIFDLRSEKEVFPERIKEMDASLEAKKTGMEAAEGELKALQVEKKGKETELASGEEKAKKHEGELYNIKNNKEYAALKLEIGSIKADISLIEEDIIGLFDKIDAATAKFESEKKKFEEEAKEIEKEKEKIKIEEKKIDDSLAGIVAQRALLAKAVDEEALGKYEAILKKKGQQAIAKVDGDTCGACHMALRPQIINEAKRKTTLTFCETCFRILYDD